MERSSLSEFLKGLPVAESFVKALPASHYSALPDNWYVGVTDVVSSRQAIAQGKYKAVNMAGVSMISAIMNALGHQEIPYIFGGDGAAVVFSEDELEIVKDALQRTIRFAADELELELRASIVPVSELRESGREIRIAKVKISEAIENYAFFGGGISHAESLMKKGAHRVEISRPGDYPDLTGLSCRWQPVGFQDKTIVSLIVEHGDGNSELPLSAVERLFELVGAGTPQASPMPVSGPGFSWPPPGLSLEAKATGMGKFTLGALTLLAWVLDKTGMPIGKFDPKRYREFTALNTDFRKVQDGLRMTISLQNAALEALKGFLEQERQAGRLHYGICEQSEAVLTCFVPSVTSDSHFHFLDGTGGGYAAAASNLEELTRLNASDGPS